MAKEIIIYDTVRNHLDQDYQGSEILPKAISDTMIRLLRYLDLQSSSDDRVPTLLSKHGEDACKFVPDSPIDYKIDSTMFTDEGNKLMGDCYNRWVASITFDPVGNSEVDSYDGLISKFMGIKPTPLTYGGFTERIEAMKGNPMYINTEVNKDDTYKDVKDIPVTENFLNLLNSYDVVNESKDQKVKPITEQKKTNSFLDMFNQF